MYFQNVPYYPYIAYVHNLLYYGEDAKKSKLQATLFFKDDEDHIEASNPWATDNANSGLKRRAQFFRRSRSVHMISRIHADAFECPKLLCDGCEIRIKLTRSEPAFCLMADDATPQYKIVMEKAVLHVRHIELDPFVHARHLSIFGKGMVAKYPIRKTMINTLSIGQGEDFFNKTAPFVGRIPDLLIIYFVKSGALNGNYKLNPFNFIHCNLSTLSVKLGSEYVTGSMMQFDFEKEHYDKAYTLLYENTGKGALQDSGNNISVPEFRQGYAVFVFDLTADRTPYDLIKSNALSYGTLQISGNLSTGVTEPTQVVLIGRFSSHIEIDSARAVTVVG